MSLAPLHDERVDAVLEEPLCTAFFFSLSRRIWINRVASETVEPTYTARPHQEHICQLACLFFFFCSGEPSRHDAPQGPNVDSVSVDESQKPRSSSVDRTLLRAKLLPMRHLPVCHAEYYADLDQKHVLRIPVCARSKQPCLTAVPNQKSCLSTQF